MTLTKMLLQIPPLNVYHHITANRTSWNMSTINKEQRIFSRTTDKQCRTDTVIPHKNMKRRIWRRPPRTATDRTTRSYRVREEMVKSCLCLHGALQFNTEQIKDVDLTLAVENSRPNAKSRNTTPNWATVSTYIKKYVKMKAHKPHVCIYKSTFSSPRQANVLSYSKTN